MSKTVSAGIDPFDQTVGAAIRLVRKQRALTQVQLAAAIGVSFQQIQKYETGVNRVSASSLSKIAAKLDVPTSLLLGEEIDLCNAEEWGLSTGGVVLDLVRAFAGVRSPAVRRQLVQFVQSLAENDAAAMQIAK
jgi:transcriptional regulator with XRE-family HTH domain